VSPLHLLFLNVIFEQINDDDDDDVEVAIVCIINGVYRLARSVMLTPGNGSRQGVPDILLIITDGQSDNPPETWVEAIEARRQGINVIAVCIC